MPNYNGDVDNTDFNSYLISEYDHIAEAHFKTNDTITAFFRYYLLIMSIPISLIAAFLSIAEPTNTTANTISNYLPIIAAIFLVIFIAGFGVMLYLINLRMDAVLYARTVNAIRKHFYDNVPNFITQIDAKIHKRVLPQTRYQPNYLEWRFFGPVVIVMAFFNTFYLFCAIALFGGINPVDIQWEGILCYAVPTSVVFWILHPLTYFCYAKYRDGVYLTSHILGVDICGVLNEHRPRFCEVLQRVAHKTIDPEDITVVPVHEHPSLGIERKEERKVFNEPEYWTKMEPTPSSAERLTSIRKAFKFKIMLFTHRPWPNPADLESEEECEALKNKWKIAASDYYQLGVKEGKLAEIKIRRRPITWLRMKFPISPVEQITRNWLEWNGFEYNKLVIEKGSDDIEDPQAHIKNRFYISKQKRVKYFVEDLLEKAEKLAHICDVVFLYDHPYNRNTEGKQLPSNIIRVYSWQEIYRQIRRLS